MKNILVGYGVDVDAVAGWIDTKDGGPADLVSISRGIYGATVGIDRLLNLFNKYDIKASWYVPGHTLETFPSQISKIVAAGHEIGLHGYTHEDVSQLSEAQERDVLQKSIQVLTDFTGTTPKGWTAPAWTTSSRTVHLLEEMGVEYDHSFMHHDCQLYRTPYSNCGATPTAYTSPDVPASSWMKPMPAPTLSSLVTVPANWHLDDWPPFSAGDGGSDGFVDQYVIERMWKDHFEFCYEEYPDGFVFPISVHPQVSGKPQVVKMHQRVIEWINRFEEVEWCTFAEMARRFQEGGMAGWDVRRGMGLGS